jgi:excisionase family DNA binding protein
MNQATDSETKQTCLAHSIETVADMLDVSTKTVRRLIDAGRLKILPGIRHKRITASSLEQFMASAI